MPSKTGTNLILSSLLATLSYLPFKIVAKFTLIVCLLLFIIDPYPGSRLVVFVAVGGVLVIHRVRRRFLEMHPEEEAEVGEAQEEARGTARVSKQHTD